MKLLVVALFFMSLTSAAWAAEDAIVPSPWKAGSTYGEQSANKLGFGAKNFLLGWTELFNEPIESYEENKSLAGIGQGLGNAVMDTVGGFLHVITFPLTGVDIPLPENGVSIGAENEDIPSSELDTSI